jgi:hypothetical protein
VRLRDQQKKQAWFNQGVEALQRARPGAPRLYCCPLCIRGFDTPLDLSFEDVPPKSIGGKPLVLTCRLCNNTFGHRLDAHIRSGRDLLEIQAGNREAFVKVTHSGHTIAAKARFSAGRLELGGLPEHSDPRAHQAFFANLERLAETKSRDWGFTLELGYRHSPRKETVAWLRMAYLYAFAALGYRFVMRPELDVIRMQFLRPEEDLLPGLVRSIRQPIAGEGISFVHSPAELRSILVRLNNRLFFFPDFQDAQSFFHRIAPRAFGAGRVRMTGKHMDLPRRPQFAFDFAPQLISFICPPPGPDPSGI